MGYKKVKKSLNTRLIIYLVSVILLVVISIGVSINNVFERKFEEYIIGNNEKEVFDLIDLIELEYEKEKWNIHDIEEIGKKAISKGIFVDIYDTDNNLVWGAMQYNQELCSVVMGNIKSNMHHMTPGWKGEYTKQTYNLEDLEKKNIGYIQVGSYGQLYYMDNDIDFLKEINKVIIVIGVIMTLIVIIVAIIIAKKISRPIETVSVMAKLIGDGGYNNKLDYESDISEIDNLIKSINNLAYKLDEQENLRKRLTTDISHELRTPLTSIQTHLEAMIDGIWKPSIDRLNSVNEEVIRLANLVNQLKNLAKFDSEKSKLILSEVNLDSLIKNIVYNNQGNALEKNISITFELENINTYLDKEKISQVIVNLLSNAIRYTNENGNIHLSAYKENENIKIHFKDNGIGIPKESLNYIFERFYRVDESRSKHTGGIGVGLTIVKSIIDLHNGNIDVKSNINEGSEFILTLPMINPLNIF